MKGWGAGPQDRARAGRVWSKLSHNIQYIVIISSQSTDGAAGRVLARRGVLRDEPDGSCFEEVGPPGDVAANMARAIASFGAAAGTRLAAPIGAPTHSDFTMTKTNENCMLQLI